MALNESVIGSAIIEVRADMDRLRADFQKANAVVKKGAEKQASSLDKMRAAITKARGAYAAVGAAIATAFAGRAMVQAVQNSINFADNIGKVASKLGVSTDALQEFRFAAQQAGVAQQTLDMGLQRFIRRFQEAQAGTGEAKDAIKELGIALTDAAGNARRGEDAFADAMEALAGVDTTKRLRLAFKLFDSEGVALVNLANNFEEMRIKAREAGIVISSDTIRAAAEAKETIDALSASVKKEFTESLVTLAPALVRAANLIRGVAIEVGNVFRRLQDVTDLGLNDLKEQLAENEAKLREFREEAQRLEGTLADIPHKAARDFNINLLAKENRKIIERISLLEEQQRIELSNLETNRAALTEIVDLRNKELAAMRAISSEVKRARAKEREELDKIGRAHV